MKLEYLWIDHYKNLRNCEIDFTTSPLLTAIIGLNGSGKSNLLEAILHILIGVYFQKAPPFDFRFQYESQRRRVTLTGEHRRLSVEVDGEFKSLEYFASRLRDGPAQVFYPELTFVYYSGECQRVRQLISRYKKHFQKLTREPDMDSHRPLFVESSNQQAEVILLALFAHRKHEFLRHLSVQDALDVSLVLRSPEQFNPEIDEPKLWGTEGAVRRIIAAIDDTAEGQESRRAVRSFKPVKFQDALLIDESPHYTETRTYHFGEDGVGRQPITALANRLEKNGDNLYLALEHLRARGILKSVTFKIKSSNGPDVFEFDHLSEGEKQLIAVVGAIHLTNQAENLVLLDEPDTHLNPHWSWEYPQMLTEAFNTDQRQRTAVLLTTHGPVMISGFESEQVFVAKSPVVNVSVFAHPRRNPRGQGIANILASSEFFGLPSSLDKETQKLLDERLAISIKPKLSATDKERLRELNRQLEFIKPGVSERDPDYVAFLRQKYETGKG
jgi:energy-coupling factor transporter ATP-binding protein EcfA2